MTKRYTVLQKKLKELESQLNQVFSLPLDTPCHQRFSQDIQQRFLFLNNLLSAEIASRPRKPFHSQHIAQRLLELEAAFQEWDSFQSSAPDHVEKGSTCSCTESCLNDGEPAEGSSELISLSDLEQAADASKGFNDQNKVEHVPELEPKPVENHKSTEMGEPEKRKEEERVWVEGTKRSMIRKEETKGVWFGKCLAPLASGVLIGMGFIAFFMVRFPGCFCRYDSIDYTLSLIPT